MMNRSKQKSGRVLFNFALLCTITAVCLLLSADYGHAGSSIQPAQLYAVTDGFDENGTALFKSFDKLSKAYMAGGSSARTLEEYYSRRQYPGSPPPIPHAADEIYGEQVNCLACHAKGGWVASYKRNAPITPHPEQVSCRQCHVQIVTTEKFVESTWQSITPPRLGGAHLPGSPPPILHSLQMRGNCLTCHVGPGAVVTLRVEHASRGSCRQCHVPEADIEPFRRKN